MINKWIGVGRLAAEPDQKFTQSGKSVASFTLCCDNGYGEKKTTEFVKCVAWEQKADFISQYGKKGNLAYVEGRLQTRSWEDQSGVKKYTTEIIVNEVKLLSPRSQDDQQGHHEYEPPQGTGGRSTDDQDVPF